VTSGAKLSELVQEKRHEAPPVRVERLEPPRPATRVEVIRGNKRTTETF